MSAGAWRRWFRFNAVGAIGIVVQLAALSLLTAVCGLHYLLATLVAVEFAIVHNFLWHDRWTWSDRQTDGAIRRLARFNLANGLVSLVGNLALMPLLVQLLHLGVIPANVIAIALCSLANFLLADRVVFTVPEPRTKRRERTRYRAPSHASERQNAFQSRACSGGARFLSPGAK